MEREKLEKTIKKHTIGSSKKLLLKQLDNFYKAESYKIPKHEYKDGDYVKLKKGTLLHGTSKNIEGLERIVKDGLLATLLTRSKDRLSKYPACVSVWNLKDEYFLKDYINYYSGGTIKYFGIVEEKIETGRNKTSVIPYNRMNKFLDIVTKTECHKWILEQTKEARFLPSLIQNNVQIGIIYNGNNQYAKELLKGDILNPKAVNDKDVKVFVSENSYKNFINDRKNKDDLFTDRESAILVGLPSSMIEGILVGRIYEKNLKVLKEIKELLPHAYICNLDGKVIVE